MNHKGTVTLETERLILRRFEKNDLEPMFHNVWNNYEVWKWSSYEPMNSIDDIRTLNNIFTDFWFAKYEKPDYYNWAIELKSSGEVIGRFRGINPSDRANKIELAYELGQNWWGQGFMTEAVNAALHFFFNDVGFNRVYAGHASENPASGKVMQKCGMTYEGTMRQHTKCNVGLVDEVFYGILASEFIMKQILVGVPTHPAGAAEEAEQGFIPCVAAGFGA
ncbi:MAG: GNAT family N-acetyltransferase, partial [Firmicutes bacterium]|nr:GNAT family N-acetyltransferase [Bacillota bacterium]